MNDNREIVHSISYGNIVIDIVKKVDDRNGNIFYDYRTSRKCFLPDGEPGRSAYMRKFDVQDNVRALMDVLDWMLRGRG